jgi:hypothetical protein
MNRPLLIATAAAHFLLASSAHASMSLSSWQPVQPAAKMISSPATTPGDVTPAKASTPVTTGPAITKPSADKSRAAGATGRPAGTKRPKAVQAEDGDEHGEELAAHKARPVQRAASAREDDDNDVRGQRKRGLDKIERILHLVHGMRPNFFARWR